MQQIRGLQDRFGFSVLFITHDISLMVEMSDRMAVMYNGRIVEMAESSQVFADPLHPYTRALMNSFPPLTGERRRLTGLADAQTVAAHGDAKSRLGFDPTDIPDLSEVRPGRWIADPNRTRPAASVDEEGGAR